MARRREVAQLWLVSATAIVLSFALHSPNRNLVWLNSGLTVGCVLLVVAHQRHWLTDRRAVYACLTLLMADILLSAIQADGFVGMSLVWPVAVAFPALAIFGRKRFVWLSGFAWLLVVGVAVGEYSHAFVVHVDAQTYPLWWWQCLAWILTLLVALPFFVHHWQQRYLKLVHHQSLALEQMRVELNRQALRQHRFLARVAGFLRAPLHEVWLGLDVSGAPARASPLMAAVHDLYVTLSNLQDSGALDDGDWSQFHLAPVHLPAFVQSFQDYPPYPERVLSVRMGADLPDWVEIDGKRLGQLLTNLLQVARVVTNQLITTQLSYHNGRLQIVLDLFQDTDAASVLAMALEGERHFPLALQGACLRLLINQRLAHSMGGKVDVYQVNHQMARLCLTLPAPELSPVAKGAFATRRMQIALLLADGVEPRPLSMWFRSCLIGDHAWRVFNASSLPDLGFDLVVVMLDDWDMQEPATRGYFEKLRINNAHIWGVTNGLSPEEVATWRELGTQRIWLRPIDDTAWAHHLRACTAAIWGDLRP